MAIQASARISIPGGSVSQDADKPKKKDLIDHWGDYVNTSDGAQDFFRVSSFASQCLKQQKFAQAADFAGGALAIPFCIKNVNDVRHDIRAYKDAKRLAKTDPTRQEKVHAAAKKGVMDACTGLNNAAMGALSLNNAKIVTLGKSLPGVLGLYNGTTLVTDTSDGLDQCKRIVGYQKLKQTASKVEKKFLPSLTNVAIFKLIKAVSSVALAIMGFIAIFFTAAVSLPFFLPVTFVLGGVWLGSSLIGYFYNEIVKEDMIHAKVSISVKV